MSECKDLEKQGEAATQPDAGGEEAKELAKRRRRQKDTISDFLIKLAVFVVAVWAIFSFVLGIYQISGQAMYPSLRDGDLVLTWRLERSFAVGDVVTFDVSGNRHTARVVAMEGDVVELSGDGLLIVNGNVEADETFFATEEQTGGIEYPYTVPAASYFMLCDNREGGIDSRSFGAISEDEITGKVIGIFRRRGI